MKKIKVLIAAMAMQSALFAITVTVAPDTKKGQVTTPVAQRPTQPGTLGTGWGA